MAKVKFAKLTKNTFAPDVGVIDQTLPPKNKTWPSLEMESSDIGLTLNIGTVKGLRQILIPYHMVECYCIDPEKPATVKELPAKKSA